MRRDVKALSATGVLADFQAAGVLALPDVHVARTLARLGHVTDESVILATALAVAALRAGSVCLDVMTVATTTQLDEAAIDEGFSVEKLPWPEATAWLNALLASPLVAVGENVSANQKPLRLVEGMLYLERYWNEEEFVRNALLDRAELGAFTVDEQKLTEVLDALFGPDDPADPDLQRLAVHTAAHSRTTVIAGGPGTGKTTVIARLLVALRALLGPDLRVGLAAPSGKAAARIGEVLADAFTRMPADLALPSTTSPLTLHRLLGSRGLRGGFTANEFNQLPYHVAVIDEMSMVALPMMAALLRAMPHDTRLVMVGDPDQLESIEAGAVLADIVAARLPIDNTGSASSVVQLTRNHRNRGNVSALADAIRRGNAADALEVLMAEAPDVEFVPREAAHIDLESVPALHRAVIEQGSDLRAAAITNAPEIALQRLDAHRIVCAHRTGPYGVARWAALVDRALRSEIPGYATEGEWFPGRAVLITQNSAFLDVSNGDTGVVVATDDGPRVALSTGEVRLIEPTLLDDLETLNVMTVHKAQGSQFDWVTLILPPETSPLLTRELLYTAVTRAQSGVRIIGTPEAVAKAINTPARRASGLADRLKLLPEQSWASKHSDLEA